MKQGAGVTQASKRNDANGAHLLRYLLTSSVPFPTKPSLRNWLSLGMEVSNLNGNLEGPALRRRGGDA